MTDLSLWARGGGGGGPPPLFFKPNWGPKGIRVWMPPPPPPPPPPPYLKVWIRHWMFSYKWIKGALSRLSWSFFTYAPISVKVALVKPWSMLHSQMFPKHIKYSKKKKWTLKTCQPNKFSIHTISIRFSLLQVCPSVPYFLCALLFIPSFNVFSGYFYAFCNLVAVPTRLNFDTFRDSFKKI